MAESATVTILEHGVKSGSTNGRNWTAHDLVDGNKVRYGTFDSGVGQKISDNVGKTVDITFDTNDRGYKRLLSVKEHKDAQAQKDSNIVREVAVKAAATFLAHNTNTTTGDLIAAAKVIEQFILSTDTDSFGDAEPEEWSG